jgi:spore coat protein A
MFLNACNARVLNLQLYIRNAAGEDMTLTQEMVNGVRQVDSSGVPIMVPTNSTGPEMIQIGNEAGFLFAPAVFDTTARPIGYDLTGGPVGNTPPTNSRYGNANRYNLLLGGAERADVLIDFNGLSVGTKLILYSDAPAPFPAGDNRNDYFFGQPDLSSPAIGGNAGPAAADAHGPNGYGPNSRTLMQIEIVVPKSSADMPRAQMMTILTQQLRTQTTSLGGINSAPIRDLTLNEDFDQFGRLVQMIGTDTKLTPASPTFGRLYADPPTELVTRGTKEIWRIWNMTADTHPIHFHLVNVQVLGRAQFDGVNPHTEVPGTFKPADANENGWKETVRMNPGEVIYLIMKFELPITPFVVPGSPRLAAMGFPNAHEYVYHCHILEHEEHDMMRTVVFT